MCTVEKLLIKGIRSFSPENQDVIEFFKPLTLIVGSNGAGKTTVIECLKQACTGELPPNTRSGQSFIHDPKVAGQTEVKAQIKLRFRTSTGQPVVCIRSFQLLQKKATLQFKTLDSVLQTMNKDTGEKQAITYKCADIDRIIPSLMGVSKAVLENVIFVHQEDSNWPLAEGQVLKKKFDDIFAATKYTKALEALRKIRTEKAQQCKEHRLKLEHLGTIKEQAVRLQSALATSQEAQERIQGDIQGLLPLIQEQERVLEEVNGKLVQLAEIEGQLSHLRGMLSNQVKTTALAFGALKDGDYEESTQEMQEWLRQCDREMYKLNQQMDSAQSQAAALMQRAGASRTRIGQLEDLKQRLEVEKLQQEDRVAGRDALLRGAATQGLIVLPPGTGAQGPLSAAAASQMIGAVEAYAGQLEASLEALKKTNREADRRMGQEVEEKGRQIAALQEGVRSRQGRLQSNERRMEQLGQEIGRVMITKAALEEMKAREEAARRRVEEKKGDFERLGLGEAAARETAAVDAARRRIAALRLERAQVQAATDEQKAIQFKRQEVLTADERLAAGLVSRRARLLGLLGATELPGVEELRDHVDAVVRSKKQDSREAANTMRSLSAKLNSLQGELRTVQQQLHKSESALESARSELRAGVRAVLGQGEDEAQYAATLSGKEASTEVTLKRVLKASSMVQVMTAFKEVVQVEGEGCPICHRDFRGEERAQCLEYIDEELQALPQQLARKEAQLATLKQQVADLRQLQPLWHRFQELEGAALPPLRERVAALQHDVQQLTMQVDEAGALVAVLEHEEGEASKVAADVAACLVPLHAAAAKARSDLQYLEARAASAAVVRTVADVDGDLEEEERVRDRHQREFEDLMQRQSRGVADEAALSEAWSKARLDLSAGMGLMKQRVDKEAQVAALEKESAELKVQVAEMEVKHEPLEADRTRLHDAREAARRAAEAAEREAGGRVMAAVQLRDKLAGYNREIRAYQAADKEGQLARKVEEIEQEAARAAAMEAEARALQKQGVEHQKTHAEQEVLRSDIGMVLAWRAHRDAEEGMRAQVSGLEAQLGQVGDGRALQRQREEAEVKREGLKEKRDMLQGELNSEASTAQRARKDLAHPEYRGIEDKYRQQQVKLRTTEMANGDVEKYHKALEKALLAFHSAKMADINRIVKELWQKTYRGQDIDFIAIKADADGLRSYNYRVVMYSGGAELDMRGRCSAGQKVLASLVIRLALAETFCLSCGILALDEPTTNLDAANAASLAEALASVMQNRVGQDNFQLIVITHDERFAALIGTREHVEKLWRITKDVKQHTSVRAEALTD